MEDTTKPMTTVDLSGDDLFDLADVEQRFPTWLRWMDADYGSAAFLPLLDNGRFDVTLSAAGGLVARQAYEATEVQLRLIRYELAKDPAEARTELATACSSDPEMAALVAAAGLQPIADACTTDD